TLDAGAGFTSYLWSNGDTTRTINVTTNGTFTVRVTNASGCQSLASASVTVTVTALPVATITPSGPTSFCQGGSVTLDAGARFNTYLWSSVDTTRAINVATNGTFTVRVTNASGCQSLASAS